MCVLRPLPGSIFPRHKQLLWGYTGVFWQPLGHGSQGYMCPGKEPGPQTGAGDMRNLNGWSQKQQQGRKGTHPNTDFQLKEERQNILYCNVKYIYICVFYRDIYQNIVFSRTLYFLRNFGYSIFSFLMKAKGQWPWFLRVRKSDLLLPKLYLQASE